MPDNDQNNQNNNSNQNGDGSGRRGHVSWSFIVAIVIIVAIVGLIIWFFAASSSSSTTFTTEGFVTYVMNDCVTEMYETPKENTVVVIEGYYKQSPSATTTYSFTYTVSYSQYYEVEQTYSYQDATTNEWKQTEETTLVGLVNKRVNYQIENGYSDVMIVVVSDAYQTSWWSEWGATLIITIVMILIFVWLFWRLSRSMNQSNNQAMNFNRSRARKETHSNVKFDNVAGCDEEKAEMQELVSYLKDPKKYVKYGAKLPKGILLVGPPGCGKTLLAKAVAGEAGVPFYSISGSDFVEMFVGVGAGRVRDMFKTAKQNAPCIVFIDEIDAVGRQRGAGMGGGNDEREQTLNQLLVEMDGFSDNSGILVIAATNRDDVLDPALLRAGRFDRKITVSYPDRKGREEIFKVHSRNKQLAPDVDFEALSKRTVGFSGADIENIMNEAAILAVRENLEYITMDIIDEAIDRRIAGPAKSSRGMSEIERKTVAYHEAGHAVVGIHCPYSDKVQKITIIPRGNTGGHVRMGPEEDRFIMTKNQMIAEITGYMGGRASEEIFFDDISSGAQNDIEMATRLARMMVTELGMSSLGPIQYESDSSSVFLGRDYNNIQKNFSSDTALEIDREVRKIIDEAHDNAVKLLTEYKDDVILIANTLLENETITAEEIDYLLKYRKPKPKNTGKPKEEEKVEPPISTDSSFTNIAPDPSVDDVIILPMREDEPETPSEATPKEETSAEKKTSTKSSSTKTSSTKSSTTTKKSTGETKSTTTTKKTSSKKEETSEEAPSEDDTKKE
ncbi:MAG: ATP-dependent zinc metalloprotease FtsH [Coprobacillus sp.]|nr:ATP-dependent zinc metalloprotease FtsH [Coprobacillus sp.]